MAGAHRAGCAAHDQVRAALRVDGIVSNLVTRIVENFGRVNASIIHRGVWARRVDRLPSSGRALLTWLNHACDIEIAPTTKIGDTFVDSRGPCPHRTDHRRPT